MFSIIHSWWESVSLLTPSSLKQWGLVTLKGATSTYKVLCKYFWWLFILIGVLSYYSIYYKYYIFLVPFALCAIVCWCICCFLAVRPSVGKKDGRYFLGFLSRSSIALVFGVCIFFILLTINSPRVVEFSMLSPFVLFLISMLIYTMHAFTLFFLFDSKLSLQAVYMSVWNGVKMLAYVLPLCTVVSLIVQMLLVMLWWHADLFKGYDHLVLLAGCLLFALYLHMFLYIYIKELYGHTERY